MARPSSDRCLGLWVRRPAQSSPSRSLEWAVACLEHSVFRSTGTTSFRAGTASSKYLRLAGTGDCSGTRTSRFPTRPTPRSVVSSRTSSSTHALFGFRRTSRSRWRSCSRSPWRAWVRRSTTLATGRIASLTGLAWASFLAIQWAVRSPMTTSSGPAYPPSRRP